MGPEERADLAGRWLAAQLVEFLIFTGDLWADGRLDRMARDPSLLESPKAWQAQRQVLSRAMRLITRQEAC